MRNERHELLLQKILMEFRKKGFKVIRLRKKIPDAIIVKDGPIIGIEVTSGSHRKIFHRKKTYVDLGFEFDEVILIGDTAMKEYGIEQYTPPEAYFLASKLRKKGLKLKDIQKIIEKKFKVSVSIPTLSNWTTGKTKPYLARNLED